MLDQEHGGVLHDLWEEVFNHPQLLEEGVAKYLKVASCSDVNPSLKKESQVFVVNGIIMVSQAHNMCKPGLDPIDCKSSQ